MRIYPLMACALAVSVGACSKPATPEPKPTPSPSASPRDFSGRWTGVEGMYLVVRADGPGRYALEMQYDLDHRQTVAGRASDGGIAFERDGRTLMLRPSGGEATGLKYLAGKTDCLTVAPGEGYCRG